MRAVAHVNCSVCGKLIMITEICNSYVEAIEKEIMLKGSIIQCTKCKRLKRREQSMLLLPVLTIFNGYFGLNEPPIVLVISGNAKDYAPKLNYRGYKWRRIPAVINDSYDENEIYIRAWIKKIYPENLNNEIKRVSFITNLKIVNKSNIKYDQE